MVSNLFTRTLHVRTLSTLVGLMMTTALFVGGASAQNVKFLGEDRVTQGKWRNVYGSEGVYVIHDQIFNPAYGATAISGLTDFNFSASTSDPRGLQRVNIDSGGRVAGCYFTDTTGIIDVNCPPSEFRRFSIYCVDWDNYGGGRNQTFEVRDAVSDALLDTRNVSAFGSGVYLRWNIKGSVKIRLINNNPSSNALLLGWFFDPAIQDPTWWSVGQPIGSGNPPVIDPAVSPDNNGAATIGQAKWMAKSAIEALRSVRSDLATLVEADLAVTVPNWGAPTTPEQIEALKAPLTIGQLKALSAPFYKRLYAFNEAWLLAEMVRNGTAAPGSHLPWFVDAGPDNLSPANVGQLKAIFALRFAVGLDGLVAHWKMNTATDSGGVLFDSGPPGLNPATLNGPSRTGGFNSLGGIRFDGSDDDARTPSGGRDYTLNQNDHSFTLSVWFRTTSTGISRLVTKGDAQWLSVGHAAPGRISLGVDVTDITDEGIVGTANTFNDGLWHHVVGICHQSQGGEDNVKRLRIYVDGELQQLVKYPGSGGTLVEGNTALDFSALVPVAATRNETGTLGSRDGSGEFLNGELDDARIYSRALDAAGALALYNLDENNNGLPDRTEGLHDYDYDLVPYAEDTDPSDPNFGRLEVTITSPVDNASVR